MKTAGLKTAGMIGGIGPESTAMYYRLIIAEYRKIKKDDSYPSIFINSINMRRMRDLVEAGDLPELTSFLSGHLQKLVAAGASFGFLASNTPHLVFDELQRRSPIPLISIVETACAAAKGRGFRRLGLLGARFTMQATFYQEVFAREGITIVPPNAEEQDYVHDKYMGELVNGILLAETRQRFVEIMERLRKRESVEAVILGGTELSLLFEEEMAAGIPLLDTTKLHVNAIVAELLR